MLGDSILFMKFPDYPTIISIVGVLLVEDAVAAASTFITLRAVPAALLMIRLHREGSSHLTLRVLGLGPWGKRLRQVVHEEPPLLGLGASVGDLEEPDDGSQLVIHGQLFFILMSATPVENAEMTSSLEIQGMLFLIWLKHWMYWRSVLHLY
jgi:isoprenylcysteine carboxyl methyltransferase (ICMT) family protein YpbQ